MTDADAATMSANPTIQLAASLPTLTLFGPSRPSEGPSSNTSQLSATLQTSHLTVTLDHSSDLTLVIGADRLREPFRVKVSKSTLTRCSPVWRAMFSPGRWAESSKTEVAFPDDNIVAMLVVLRIAHLRFRELPKKFVPLSQLAAIAVVCDKYATVSIVKPFLDRWVKPPTRFLDPDWLFFSWVFGYDMLFQTVADSLVKYVDTSSDIYPALLRDPKPPGIVESILGTRVATIQRILDMCYYNLDEIASGRRNCCLLKSGSKACNTMIVGTLYQAYCQAGILPTRLTGQTATASIDGLISNLGQIDFYADSAGRSDGAHMRCVASAEVISKLLRIRDQIPRVTHDSHLRYMQAQKKL